MKLRQMISVNSSVETLYVPHSRASESFIRLMNRLIISGLYTEIDKEFLDLGLSPSSFDSDATKQMIDFAGSALELLEDYVVMSIVKATYLHMLERSSSRS